MFTPTIHILNGEALAGQLGSAEVPGEYIVWNEALIDGPVAAHATPEFWAGRAAYIHATYGASPEEYAAHVRTEFDKLAEVPETAELHFWFEHDLFCQANLWFLLACLADKGWTGPLWRVAPQIPADEDVWQGFGRAEMADLQAALAARVPIGPDDLALGRALWQAYAAGAHADLLALAERPTAAFQHLPAVCRAHVERFPADGPGRPQRQLMELRERHGDDFAAIFTEFVRREGIYGFGDAQIAAMLLAL